MRNGRGKLYMPHALSSDLRARHLHAAAVADQALISGAPLIFAAGAFPVAGGPEYALAEKAVPFGLKSAVIDCFGLFESLSGPFAYLFRRRKADLYGIKIV